MDRRDFLKVTGAAGLATMWGSSLACAHSTAAAAGATAAGPAGAFSISNVGLQLYTVRDAAGKDLDGTLAAVAGAGYHLVETAGLYGRSATDLRAIFDKHGIRAVSGHYPLADLEASSETVFTTAKTLGQEYVVVPFLDPALRTADTLGSLPGRLNKLGEAAKAAGLKLAYHNHDFEFVKEGNGTVMELLLKNTDPALVDFEMDIYWVTKAGADPLDLIARYPKRFPLMHAKDASPAPDRNIVDVGSGTIDFAKIFKQERTSGMTHVYVERDNPTDAMDTATKSFQYLAKLKY